MQGPHRPKTTQGQSPPMLDNGRDYIGRGWNPVPIQYRGKGPTGGAP
jgi:hypothetical protein